MSSKNSKRVLTVDCIARSLHESYQPGAIVSTDGYSDWVDDSRLKCAAVLIPFVRRQAEWSLVFTRRTDTVEHHKGQVSFPGGGCDDNETTAEQTALREVEEEIGVKPEDVHLLGRLNGIVTITGFRVTPVVGVIPWPYRFHLETAEVSRVFTIPLLWLADRHNWDEQVVRPLGNQQSFPVIRYHLFDDEILWGASARITRILLSVLGLSDSS